MSLTETSARRIFCGGAFIRPGIGSAAAGNKPAGAAQLPAASSASNAATIAAAAPSAAPPQPFSAAQPQPISMQVGGDHPADHGGMAEPVLHRLLVEVLAMRLPYPLAAQRGAAAR